MYGTDCFLGSGSGDALKEFKDNAAYAQRMRDASHRILYTVANYSAAMNGLGATDTVEVSLPAWRIALLAVLGVLAAVSVLSAVMYGISWKKQRETIITVK